LGGRLERAIDGAFIGFAAGASSQALVGTKERVEDGRLGRRWRVRGALGRIFSLIVEEMLPVVLVPGLHQFAEPRVALHLS
jgi:hypothetical protein